MVLPVDDLVAVGHRDVKSDLYQRQPIVVGVELVADGVLELLAQHVSIFRHVR